MTRRTISIWLLVASVASVAAAAAGCADAQYHLALHYPDAAAWERAHRAELVIARGAQCTILGSGQSVDADAVLAQLDFATDDSAPRIGELSYGTLTFFTRIRDLNCIAFLAGCTEQEIKPRTDTSVTIVLEPCTEAGCATGTACLNGACVTAVDASFADTATTDSNAPDLRAPDTAPPGCWIAATGYASGEINPVNNCQSCQPEVSTTAWTDLPSGTSCGSSLFCSHGQCGTGCWIGPTFYLDGSVNPDNTCQSCQSSASPAGWSNVANGTFCDVGRICAFGSCQTGCWIDSAFHGQNDVNSGNVCQSCQPEVSTAGWSPVTNGVICGTDRTCLSGVCSNSCGGTAVLAIEPGAPCDFVGSGDLDTCLDDVYDCAGPDLTECVNSGIDDDGDNYSLGDLSCDGDCGDSDTTVHFGATELCDGIDNNCDRQIDEGYGLCSNCCDSDDHDRCADDNRVCSWNKTSTYCANPAGEMPRSKLEICGNGGDDNCNDQVDEGCGAGSWVIETADPAIEDVGKYASLEVDGSGGVHVSYYDQTNGHLKYAFRNPAGQWTVETADATADRGQWTSLVLDSASTVHVAYYDATNGDLRHAWRPATGGWSHEIVDATGDSGRQASLAVDSSGKLYVVYRRDEREIRWEERPAGGAWLAPESVGSRSGSDFNIRISITEGIDFLRHVLFIEIVEQTPPVQGVFGRCAETSIGCWEMGTTSGNYGSPDFDEAFVEVVDDWVRWVVYTYDRDGGNLSEHMLSSSHSGIGGGYISSPIDEEGDVGSFVSVARDALGNNNVAYYDASKGDLKLVVGNRSAGYTVMTVDSADDVGQYTDIAVDSSGVRHIVYYDVTNGDLKYASLAW